MSNPALNTALFSRLGGTATSAGTAVFYLGAPDNQPLPYIVFDYVADRDENMDRNRTKNSVVSIRGYASTQAGAGTLDTQIDGLLHDKVLTVTGYINFWLMREDGYSLDEVNAAKQHVYMAGADYRIRLDLN